MDEFVATITKADTMKNRVHDPRSNTLCFIQELILVVCFETKHQYNTGTIYSLEENIITSIVKTLRLKQKIIEEDCHQISGTDVGGCLACPRFKSTQTPMINQYVTGQGALISNSW